MESARAKEIRARLERVLDGFTRYSDDRDENYLLLEDIDWLTDRLAEKDVQIKALGARRDLLAARVLELEEACIESGHGGRHPVDDCRICQAFTKDPESPCLVYRPGNEDGGEA